MLGMASLYGMDKLNKQISTTQHANTKKGLIGEKEVVEALGMQLPYNAYIIHDPVLLNYEADILVIEEKLGFLFIEVKTWNQHFVKQFYPNGKVLIKGKIQSPLKQAENYREELKLILGSMGIAETDLHQLISSVVVYNSIDKDTFLNRPDVNGWSPELKDKYFQKHFFYTGKEKNLYSWLSASKKFSSENISQYFSKSKLDEILCTLNNAVNEKDILSGLAIQHVIEVEDSKVKGQGNKPAGEKMLEVKPMAIMPSQPKKRLGLLIGNILVSVFLVFSILPLINSYDYEYGGYQDNTVKTDLEWNADNKDEELDIDNMNSSQSRDESLIYVQNELYNYYIVPESNFIRLTQTQLFGFTTSDLKLIRNEIYARHGYVFDSVDLQHYFETQTWYVPDESYNGELSEIEKHNVDLIQSLE